MLIYNSCFNKDCLEGKTILVTGGAGGIGFEASRSLVALGANVIIADIDKKKGELAQQSIREELKTKRVVFYHIDLSNSTEIKNLYMFVKHTYQFLDVIINNATIAPIGSIVDIPLNTWNNSYQVNLKAPIDLLQNFLPDMKKNNMGTIVFVSSSGVAPYMGAYEIFKTCQVELCNTLNGELESYNLNIFVISPGLVKTTTAMNSIKLVAECMKIDAKEIYESNKKHILNAEYAGAGFAASIVLASKYNGQEIGSVQALMDAEIINAEKEDVNNDIINDSVAIWAELIPKIICTYVEQYNGWQKRNIFERQWILRDFKKWMNCSAKQYRDLMLRLRSIINKNELNRIPSYKESFIKLQLYYKHQYQLLQGYEKDPHKLKQHSISLTSWISCLNTVINTLG